MKKRYHILWLAPLLLVVCYKVRTMDIRNGMSALRENLVSSLASTEAQKQFAQYSHPLSEYSAVLDVPLITAFLNTQIEDAGIDPARFDYYVGHAWLVFSLGSDRYGFILSSEKPFYGYLSSSLTIEALNKLLKNPNYLSSESYDDYRLKVIKTLITAQFEGVFSGANIGKLAPIQSYTADAAVDTALDIALSTLSSYASGISAYFGYAITAGSSVGSKALQAQKAVLLQMEIAEYVLKSNDIGLIKACIRDFEAQLKAEKEGFASSRLSFISRYMPTSLQWGDEGYTAKLLQLLKDYLKENEFELEMLKKFEEKQKTRAKQTNF